MGWHNNFFRTFYLYEFLNNNKNVFLFSAKGRVTDAARKRKERKNKASSDSGTATGAANDSFEGILIILIWNLLHIFKLLSVLKKEQVSWKCTHARGAFRCIACLNYPKKKKISIETFVWMFVGVCFVLSKI